MPNFLLNKKLTVNGRQIFCKVTGNPGSQNNGLPYFLMIQGGPGFDHHSVFDKHEEFAGLFGSDENQHPHFIYFDPLGCGESDQPGDPQAEYTIENFTEIAAGLIEEIQKDLAINQLDLRIFGRSFGSVIAMTLPSRRPAWTLEDSPIHLRQIISASGPCKPENVAEIMEFVEHHYKQDPNYLNIRRSVLKLLMGEIKDKEDYIKNIALVLAPLYSDKSASEVAGFTGRAMASNPMYALSFMKLIYHVLPLGMLEHAIHTLDNCNVELLNAYSKRMNLQVDLPKTIRDHADIYQRIAICCIGGDLDYIANAETNLAPLLSALPSIAGIILHAKHVYADDHPELGAAIHRFLFKDGQVDAAYLKANQSVVSDFHLPEAFTSKLAMLKHKPPVNDSLLQGGFNLFSTSSTAENEQPSSASRPSA